MSSTGNVINLHDLKVVVFPGNGVTPEAQAYYDSAYETWKSVWKQTLLELDGNDNLYSDHFSRQDYIVGLFHGMKCIALCCFRRAELNHAVDREDSWFKPWPIEALQSFGHQYSTGVVLSWLTIHSDYRRSVSTDHLKEFSASDRLCELINYFLQDCEMDVAFGVTRNNRSVNKMSEYVGFKTYQSNAKHHGVDVDLITLTPDDLEVAASKYPEVGANLWADRLVVAPRNLQLHSQTAQRKAKLKLVG